MLKHLGFENVGPAPKMEVEFSPCLNIITGDNGLGKTFLLDVAWWAFTRTWAREKIVPHQPPAEGKITYRFDDIQDIRDFDRADGRWINFHRKRFVSNKPVIYAQVDGGFSVWESERNRKVAEPVVYHFAPKEVWDGNGRCEGLIRDWALWQSSKDTTYFDQLQSVLRVLSPSPGDLIEVGELRKIAIDDPKRYPTLKMPYGQEVAIIHASAGLRRIVALAYLLVWAWQEHLAACNLRGTPPAKEIVFLIDEIEGHLHPQWQRRIVPSLLEVMKALTGDNDVHIQLITTTHSPLVLASAESAFDAKQDAWFDLNLVGEKREVALEKQVFTRLGDVSNWLTSEAFDLKQARSLEAETAIQKALALAHEDAPSKEKIEEVDADLRKSLGEIDSFWLRWCAFKEGLEVER